MGFSNILTLIDSLDINKLWFTESPTMGFSNILTVHWYTDNGVFKKKYKIIYLSFTNHTRIKLVH